MINQIWRYSHFTLAACSSVFVLLAAVTGGILALEPIDKKLQPFKVAGVEEIPLAQLIDSLNNKYDEILEISIDANQFVAVSAISMVDSLNGDFYIHPISGEKLGDIPPSSSFFTFITNLHRSLFLKTIGRIFVGVTSFLLTLIALTGLLLFIKRQKGLRGLFQKIVKEETAPHLHVVLGRWMLLPIVIVAATGVYLSLLRFSYLPDGKPTLVHQSDSLMESPRLTHGELPIFRQTKLGEVRNVEFPFSSAVEDVFTLSLKSRELKINQVNGDIVEEWSYPFVQYLSTLSFDLHTGRGSFIWSLVLFLAAISILVFMYTGALISYKRLGSRSKNVYGAEEAEIVILVGTENGSTRSFANLLQQSLLKQDQKVYVDDLNDYQSYPAMKHMVILTSTYGVGDPPASASRFLTLFDQFTPPPSTRCAVVGFGSYAYPDFCQYALDVETALRKNENCILNHPAYLIHNQSYTSFTKWTQQWGEQLGLRLELSPQVSVKKSQPSHFTVSEKQIIQDGFGDTFLLTLQGNGVPFQSGDLLAIEPQDDPVERLYSIAKVHGNQILLSVTRHEQGICSNFLYQLEQADTFEAGVQTNKAFHFPKGAPSVTLIANGTGIAPFLGMIQEKHPGIQVFLYWGGRNTQSYEIYRPWIDAALKEGSLNGFEVAYSRQESAFTYVQEIVQASDRVLADRLSRGGIIMLCGSVGMQHDVLARLEKLCWEYTHKKLSFYQNKGQLLMDCY